MLGAHLHIGFEAAAAEHDRFRAIGLDTLVVADLHATDAALLVRDQLGHRMAVADIDAHLLGGLEPAAREPDALMRGANHEPACPDHHVALADGGERDGRLHLDAPGLVHPEDGVLGIVDEYARQFGVRPAAGHAHQVAVIVAARIGLDPFVEILELILGLRHQRADLAGIVEGEAQHAAAPMRIPAPHLARRLLQHQDAFGAVLLGRDGGRKRGVSGPDDDDVERFLHGWLLGRNPSATPRWALPPTDAFS